MTRRKGLAFHHKDSFQYKNFIEKWKKFPLFAAWKEFSFGWGYYYGSYHQKKNLFLRFS